MAHRVFNKTYDLAIIGGGIVGLATARQVLLRHPKLRVCLLEKENQLATHQSKRNSGVVHAGIYYKKGSLKSRFCIRGADLVKEYCKSRGLDYKQCGKLIVATQKDELEDLHALYKNASDAHIRDIELVPKGTIVKIQPGCTTGIEALWSPNTAIVDWRQVALSYAADYERSGGEIITNFFGFKLEPHDNERILEIRNHLKNEETVKAKAVVNCAGLFSDYFPRLTGNNEHPKVVPFKGNYKLLSQRVASTIKTNIYPVPNPDLPFLGVHITPRVDGSAIVGPTSILTWGLEHYNNDYGISIGQLYHIYLRSGLRRLIMKDGNIKAGMAELYRYFSKQRLTKDVARLLPDIKSVDLLDTDFCGIRAQVVTRDGELVDDFIFETGKGPRYKNVLHVRNSPSPAATSSLPIAERISDILEERFI